MINALIIDDEKNCQYALQKLISNYCKEVNTVFTASTVMEGIDAIKMNQVDIVFLDIMIGKESGFDFLNKVKNIHFSVVFTTAYEDYALKAFKYAALDYLLKPIDLFDLQKVIQKMQNQQENHLLKIKLNYFLTQFTTANPKLPQLALSSKNEIELVNMNEIVLCEAHESYTMFYLEDKREILVSKNLKEYEDLLPENFFRIHKSYLINRFKIRKIIKSEGGFVIMSNGKTIPIAQRKKDLFWKYLNVL